MDFELRISNCGSSFSARCCCISHLAEFYTKSPLLVIVSLYLTSKFGLTAGWWNGLEQAGLTDKQKHKSPSVRPGMGQTVPI